MRIRTTLCALLCAQPLLANEPLSVIDWLSESVETPVPTAQPQQPDEEPVAQGAEAPNVTVTALDQPSPDGIGILPSNLTGLPATLWSRSDTQTLSTLVAAQTVTTYPAMHELLTTLMLAEADAPLNAGSDGAFFLARVDKLLDFGALEPASELLALTDPTRANLLRRSFDVGLLTGDEGAVCDAMRERPGLAPTYSARIFCLARNGDWSAAALTLNTAKALGKITNEQDQLLARFLDIELDAGPLAPPARVTPLEFRMREAIGEPLPTKNLPRAFSHADLRSISGWKAQLEAAERLSRASAISENRLLGIYTDKTPAASGGVWDRAEAIQRLEVAMRTGDPSAVSQHLQGAWDAAVAAQIEVPFARIFGSKLSGLPLAKELSELALRIALLSNTYEDSAKSADETLLTFATTIAQGETPTTATGIKQTAIKSAFEGADISDFKQFSDEGKLGEALLRASATFNAGIHGDGSEIASALSFFRHVGLEDIARRAALQYLLIDRTL